MLQIKFFFFPAERVIDNKNMNDYKKQLLKHSIKLHELKLRGCHLQKTIQDGIDLNIGIADQNIIFNKIKNIFLTVNIFFIEIYFRDSNIDFSLTICNTHKFIKLIKSHAKDQFFYLMILHEIKKFLFIISRYAYQKQQLTILNNYNPINILNKLNTKTMHFNPTTFLLDFGLVALPFINSNKKIQLLLNAGLAKAELFLITETEQTNYHCDFHDLISIVNLLNTHYSCLKKFKNHQEQVKLYNFSSRSFLKISCNIMVPENIIQYIIENNHLLRLDLIKTNSTIQKYKAKLNKAIWLINFKLNNNLYVKNWGTMKTSYTIQKAKRFSKQFISEAH